MKSKQQVPFPSNALVLISEKFKIYLDLRYHFGIPLDVEEK